MKIIIAIKIKIYAKYSNKLKENRVEILIITKKSIPKHIEVKQLFLSFNLILPNKRPILAENNIVTINKYPHIKLNILIAHYTL